jgi:hypothetical protein
MHAEAGAADGTEPGQSGRSPDGQPFSGEIRGELTFCLLRDVAVNDI